MVEDIAIVGQFYRLFSIPTWSVGIGKLEFISSKHTVFIHLIKSLFGSMLLLQRVSFIATRAEQRLAIYIQNLQQHAVTFTICFKCH